MDDRRVNELLLELLDVPISEREAYLAKACAGDASLAAEVAALLACEDELEGFLEQPTVPDPSGRRADEVPPPQRIGNYRIQEILGRGGMGTVYLAEQTQPIQRQVALKVISLLFGLSFIALGLIAEYLQRIFSIVTGKPEVIIEEIY